MGSMGSVVEVSPSLIVLEGVRCLECGATYSKPVFGSTVEKNPGCPACGYVGWIPISPGSPLRHSGIGVASARRSVLRLSA
jgi:hypothetical protein